MRKLAVALAVILLALSALALAPGVLTSYADILPKAIAGAALLLLIAILADRPKPESPRTAPKAAGPVVTMPSANQADSEVVNFLAILQERGRFVDFLMDDITAYSDARLALPDAFSTGGARLFSSNISGYARCAKRAKDRKSPSRPDMLRTITGWSAGSPARRHSQGRLSITDGGPNG